MESSTIDKEDILRLTDRGLSVFKHYIPITFRLGKNFLNPFYQDKKASCNVYYDRRSGVYKLKDFGNNDFSGDCFALIGKLHGLDCKQPKEFIEIMAIIDRDLHLGLMDGFTNEMPTFPMLMVAESTLAQKVKRIRPYTVVQRTFTAAELAYWNKYGITPELLKRFKVASLLKFSSENSEGKPFSFSSTPKEPIYGYTGKQHIKIYRPFSDIRFLYAGDFGDNYCFGLEQLPSKGDLLFITGGEKDVMSLTAHGFHAICFNSETAAIPMGIVRKLSYRFKHIILLFDVDKTGLDSSAKQEQNLKEYGVKRLLLPLAGTKEEKDISDYFKSGNSREDLIKLFLNYLDSIYSETMSALRSCEVDFNNPPPIAQMIVSVNEVPLGTQGNLLCVTGGEGTGKSNYISALIAGAIRKPDKVVDTLGVSVCENSKQKAILFYDTEQSEVQTYKNITNLLRRSGRETMPEYFRAYCLTGMSRKERLQSIIQSMDKFHYQYQGIHMVVIDGIADLIKGANDEAESIAVVEELYRLAGIYKTCIITVLHFIPNGLKLRGHLGSELQRKVAAILSIEKDTDPAISVVKALKVRDGSPLDVPIMQFSWDKEAGMHVYLGEKPKEAKEKRKEDELLSVAKDVFCRQRFITYVDLSEQIQAILDVKERTAKSYIKFMREKEIIVKDPSNQSYYIIGNLNQEL
ncbi:MULTISPECIES: topoisomerase [Bacteroides]|uniref:Toprim domain-containing protein n=1 Tax=Bacteroides uniformis TaxID=820 RepID=A0A174S6V1_BACUN|nr:MULTISPECIES: topoisomerase [Bacteroides]CUP92246.1 toprim domain-containing protein [Bacteroides uniformis]